MPDYDIGNILINIKVSSSKAEKSIDNIEKSIGTISDKSEKTSKSLKKMFNFGKLYATINYSKRFAQSFVNMLTSAVNFEETLNKFQVSMGQSYSRALKFVNELTYAFNLSTESIMNYQATFKNMLDAIGSLGEDNSYELSETLTRLAIDYASLFNVEINKSMEQIQGVLSGQIRQIRTTAGYDVSEASIFAIYQQLGGTKTMRQLDQLEKRLLRIIAIQQQMEKTGAVDDFQKTINKTAQQMKQISETFKEIGVWVGQLVSIYLSDFVENILAGAIALREMLKALNVAKGYQYEAAGEGGVFGEIEKSAEETTVAVEKLKTDLLGFDKLNVLGSSSSTGITTDYDLLLGQINSYTTKLSDVNNKATKIAENILKWAGYTKNVTYYTDEAGNVIEQIGWKTEGISAKFKSILSTVESIAIVFLASNGIKGAIVATTIKLTEMYLTNEKMRESINNIVIKLEEINEKLTPITTILNESVVLIIETILEDTISILNVIAKIFNFDFDSLLDEIDLDGLSDRIEETFERAKIWFKDIFKVDWNEWWAKFYASKVGQFLYVKLPDFFSKTLPNLFIKSFNVLVIKGTELIVNVLIKILNTICNGFIALASPFVKLFGKEVKYNPIPNVNFDSIKIPELASGGVLTSPTMAMVGEYSGANTNPEIVTPENLMREIFLESMTPIVQAIVNGDKQVINAIEELANRPIELNGRKVSENIYNDLVKTATRKGKIMFAK